MAAEGGQLPAHLLAFNIENVIKTRLRSLKVAKPAQIAAELASQIVQDEIPVEAFDPVKLSERGLLVYQGDVDEPKCKELIEELLATHINLKSRNTPIRLMISSVGGDVFAGFSVISAMQYIRRSGRKVHVHVSGCAMSMASIILQGGDERSIDPFGWLMLHQSSEDETHRLKTPDLRDIVTANEKMDAQACGIYASRTTKTASYWHRKMDRRDAYFSAEEALKEGLVDKILPTPRYKSAK